MIKATILSLLKGARESSLPFEAASFLIDSFSNLIYVSFGVAFGSGENLLLEVDSTGATILKMGKTLVWVCAILIP
jgi:hypothetical protein